MADQGYIDSLLNRLDAKVRQSMSLAFRHVVDGGIRIGGVDHQERARNLAWIRLDGQTSSTANAEFSIQHGLGQIPTAIVSQYVPLNSTGSQVVRLKVTRMADASRLYLSSPDTGASFSVLVEP